MAQPQLNPKTFSPTLRTPGPSLCDSDDVLLALETALALEVRGDIVEAARWLRRAANESEKQGNDTRVLLLAHAAADLTSASAQAPVTKAPPPLGWKRESLDSDPTLLWRATPPPLPASASSLPAPSTPISSVYQRSMAAQQPVIERKARLGAIRVAIKKQAPNVRSFSVERLDAHQPLPPGAVEALLVLTGEVDEPTEREAHPSWNAYFPERK
ncbi:MAG TPA: hypothetical protein VK550_31330 [Polyangiaceae bacterium]|nr:hypothetical protein [Polyangiaceae bacterium]